MFHKALIRIQAHHQIGAMQKIENIISNYTALQLQNEFQKKNDIPTLFAIIKEAVKRIYNITYYDCQIFASSVLNNGKIAQMSTGEGKTLTIAISAILNAKKGKVHIITANEYLVKRDAESLSKLYNFFGFKVGYVLENMSIEEKKLQHQCNILYATGQQLAFDFLRDNLQTKVENICIPQHAFNSIIIDEIDSILIDEAVMPLILSNANFYNSGIKKTIMADNIAKKFTHQHFAIEDDDDIIITEEGYSLIEKMAMEDGIIQNTDELYSENYEVITFMNAIYQAIHAHNLKKLDFDYIIQNKKVVIIDQTTGRPTPDRRFQNGLHQAIEAKHNLSIQEDMQTSMVITYKSFLAKYQKIAGISATVEEDIFFELYGLKVEKIPSNKPLIRNDKPDNLYQTNEERLQAIINDVLLINKLGQPILIGTTNISDSYIISDELTKLSINHNLLNAKNLAKEAEIIKNAGTCGAVTISTQMAGRGTDILIGNGNAENEEKILTLGGLCVLGFGRNKQRRIDNQLIGRSGRQGNAGVSQFYLSMEDELIDGKEIHSIEKDIKKMQEQNRIDAKNLLMQEAKRRTIEFDCINVLLKIRNNILHEKYAIISQTFPSFSKEKINLIAMDKIIQEYVDFSNQIFKHLCFQSFVYKDVFTEYKKRLLTKLDSILFSTQETKNVA